MRAQFISNIITVVQTHCLSFSGATQVSRGMVCMCCFLCRLCSSPSFTWRIPPPCGQWFSQCGVQTAASALARSFVTSTDSQGSLRPTEARPLGLGRRDLCCNQLSWWFWCTLRFGKWCSRLSLNGATPERLPWPYLPICIRSLLLFSLIIIFICDNLKIIW
jgi:hypothetical protein